MTQKSVEDLAKEIIDDDIEIELGDKWSHSVRNCVKEALQLERNRVEELENRLERINIVLEGYKVLAGLSDPDPIKIQKIIEGKIWRNIIFEEDK